MLPLGHMGITLAITRLLEKLLKQQQVDYRFLLVGAVLPDIIDKPLGYLLSAGRKFGDKSFGHSLIFLLLMLGVVLFQHYKKRNTTATKTLLLGSTTHAPLDTMWHFPKILFWPFGDRLFLTPPYEAWVGTIYLGAYKITVLLAFEIIGGSILLYFLHLLILHNGISKFIITGKITSGIRLKS